MIDRNAIVIALVFLATVFVFVPIPDQSRDILAMAIGALSGALTNK